ncbi:uncharacterized protein PFL1_06758 [Pseudozyma flocculosa PF-1]|uniref:PITH domain-containing protein n=2 Tax=Pseudozyma flocculosa TaxID=84751 RepID=A0A5C3F7T6_9BASI|nr:uncharacterized protein PFL1_06758 [Pseudozyma flocculosa PF-1]EPQ25686.1 hypothetical protein PFL1_06758 [Pseudozyma flocculosa PF-1]SPO40462.1 uncharacterized protein PSFLO_05944 [Pseudozyma flocculosa]
MSCIPTNDQDRRDDGDGRSLDPASSSAALSAVDGDATSLYQYVLRHKVWGTNLDPPESAKNVIKPWDQRLSTTESVQSNVDDQLTITVPFTCLVRIKSIMIYTGTGDFAPTRCRAFVNRPDGIDFDEADAATADTHPAGQPATRIASTLGAVGSGRAQADFALLQGQDGVVEYPVSVARFSSTNSVTLVLSHSNSTTLSRFFYLGFRGTALQLSKDPSEKLDIAAANAADKPVDGVREKRTASHGLAGGSGSRPSPRYAISDKEAARRIVEMTHTSPQRRRTSNVAPNTTPRKGRSSRGGGAAAQPSPAPGGEGSAANASTADDRTRRRSLSQPPPADTLFRQLHQQQAKEQRQQQPRQQGGTMGGAGPSLLRTPGKPAVAKTPLRSTTKAGTSATPGKRALGTPHRPGEQSIGSLAQTPATEMRKKRNDALMASAQRTREKRRQSTWGLGGWGGGREESPFDLLRRLARAPGFVAPPTPQQAADAAKMPPPPPGSAAAIAAAAARRASSSSAAATELPSFAGQSIGAGGRSSTSGRQSSMLRPGESVPGDLTRDSDALERSADMDDSRDASESSSSLAPPGMADASLASDAGAARRKSLIRGGIFAALAERGRSASARASDAGSRLSLGTAGDISALSAATSGLGGLREHELEKSLAMSLGDLDDSSLVESSRDGGSLDVAEARAIERLDELTRRSLFSNDGGLSLGPDEITDERSRDRQMKSFMRSMSEPLQVDDGGDDETGDYSSVLADYGAGLDAPDGGEATVDEPSIASSTDRTKGSAADQSLSRVTIAEEDEDQSEAVDESRVTIGSTDAGGVSSEVSRAGLDADDSASRLQDRSAMSDSRSRTNIVSDMGDVSSRSAPRGALSDEEGVDDDEAGFETAGSDVDQDEGSGAEGAADVRKLDLMDPKDLNALLKRRIVRKRKARVSPYTGDAVPQLPVSTIKDLFTAFLNPSADTQTSASLLGSTSGNGRRTRNKLDQTTLEEVEEAAHDFFGSFAQQLQQQARARTRRRSGGSESGVTMTEVDVLALLKQQGHVTARSDITSLAHRLLPREVQDQMNLPKFAGVRTETATPSIRTMMASVGGPRATAAAAAAAAGSRAPGGGAKRARQAVDEDEDEAVSSTGSGSGSDDVDDDDSEDDEDATLEDTARSRSIRRGAAGAASAKKAKTSKAPRTPVRRPASAVRR